MYRDRAHEVDEHDRAVGAILLGEDLIEQCERAATRFRDPLAMERWASLGDAQDAYPEIWRQLDRACHVLAARGVNTAGYEQLRPHVRTTLMTGGEDREQEVDAVALDDARRALSELKLALSGADWKAIHQRTSHLVDRRELRRQQWLPTLGVVGFLLVCGVSWEIASRPEKPVSQRELMQQELAEVVRDRKENIEILSYSAEVACYAPSAREYTKLLVYDGRRDDAKAFASDYTVRCGADADVDKWVNPPRRSRR